MKRTDSRSHRDIKKLNVPERAFAVELDRDGRRWIAQPRSFPLPGAPHGMNSYRPDFYLPDEDLYIEVVGCRARRAECRTRAAMFRTAYPDCRLEVREIFDAWARLPAVVSWDDYADVSNEAALTARLPRHRQPTLPGQILLDECLKPTRRTQRSAAAQMGISNVRLNEIVRGKRGVTANIALRFAKFTKTSPQFWMNLQNAVDLYRAERDMAAAK